MQFKKDRTQYKDVFNGFLVSNATFCGNLDIPLICKEKDDIFPTKVIPFSLCEKVEDYDCWVHFYEFDVNFEKFWNDPVHYLEILKKFKGVITPDFSMYMDMPLVQQHWNLYRSRALGCWLQQNGVHVIVNMRVADQRTYKLMCEGVEKYSTVAIGCLGNTHRKYYRNILKESIAYIMRIIKPSMVVLYGFESKEIIEYIISFNASIKIINFSPKNAVSEGVYHGLWI